MNKRKPQDKRRPLPSQRGKDSTETKLYVDSYSALLDFLRFRPSAVKAVYCKETFTAKLAAPCEANSVPLRPLTALAGEMEHLSSPVYGQVDLSPLGENDLLNRLAGRNQDLILALDHVSDPRNLGAIARSAAFFGVREILVPKDRQVGFTRSAVATSQGAFALTDLVVVTNLGRTLERLKEEGYWVLGTAMDGESPETVASVYDKVILVLGAEDRGISPGVVKKCDRLLSIAGAERRLGSLNVSVAAGILLRGLFFGKKSQK